MARVVTPLREQGGSERGVSTLINGKRKMGQRTSLEQARDQPDRFVSVWCYDSRMGYGVQRNILLPTALLVVHGILDR